MGKGSHRRPTKVDLEEFASSWERIFGDYNRSLKKAANLKKKGVVNPNDNGQITDAK